MHHSVLQSRKLDRAEKVLVHRSAGSEARLDDIDTRRKQLGHFLRQCRSRVRPIDLGIEKVARRRVPGLRREELCSRAGISLTWYTWLEQGREMRVSLGVLRSIADVLRLSEVEQQFLYSLIDEAAADRAVRANADVPPATLVKIIEQWTPLPALIKNYRYDWVGLNEAARETFAPIVEWQPNQPNFIRYLFLCEDARSFIGNWEEKARHTVSRFRFNVSSRLDSDTILGNLVKELMNKSVPFARLWSEADVLAPDAGVSTFVSKREVHGILEWTALSMSCRDDFSVVLYRPYDS